MGGQGSGRHKSPETIMKEQFMGAPIASTNVSDIFLPNYSGVENAARKDKDEVLSIAKGGTNNKDYDSGKLLKYVETLSLLNDSQTNETKKPFNTITGSISTTTGKVGNAINVATSAYATTTANAGITGASPRSISVWFRPAPAGHNTNRAIVEWGAGSTGLLSMVALTSANRFGFFGFNRDCSSITTFMPNTWYHGVATYDGSTGLKVYINGSLDNSATITALNTSDSIIQLCRYTKSGGWGQFSGDLDQLAIWGRELSAGEVLDLYNSGNGKATNSDDGQLKALYDFEEISTPKIISSTKAEADITTEGFTGYIYDTNYWDEIGYVENGLIKEWFYT